MATTRDPVCGMEFPEEDAEALGAFKVEHAGVARWVCSTTCRDAFAKSPARFLAREAEADPAP